MSINVINSDSIVVNFESHIKISAGPGAGKTKWLINHINNVLNNSKRLGITRKIACITYTNVAVDTIAQRLGDGVHRVYISTVHNFLYTHVLRPYGHFLPPNFELNASKMKGHDDVILSGYEFLKEWKSRTGQSRIKDEKALHNAFNSLRWKFDTIGELTVNTPYPLKVDGYYIKTASYLDYKRMAWSRGVIHHDDVLYLSHELINLFPFILEILRAKFPYFFIDEFQDISPIQLKILNSIIREETIVCAIGDRAQSIYGFLGAQADQFINFKPLDVEEFEIHDNWRSTESIINVLNLVRSDLIQKSKRLVSGMSPKILVGDRMLALETVIIDTNSEDICILTRENLSANSMRKNLSISSTVDVIHELLQKDSNKDRRRTIIRCAKSLEFAEQGFYEDALKEASKIKYIYGNEPFNQKESLQILKIILEGRQIFQNGSIFELYNFIIEKGIAKIAKPTGVDLKYLYENTSYSQLSASIKPVKDALPFRTIHKSKGDEFDCVLLVISEDEKGIFNEIDALEFLCTPNMENEEHRINYVAMSRAKNYLYINIPTLSKANKLLLESRGFHCPD